MSLGGCVCSWMSPFLLFCSVDQSSLLRFLVFLIILLKKVVCSHARVLGRTLCTISSFSIALLSYVVGLVPVLLFPCNESVFQYSCSVLYFSCLVLLSIFCCRIALVVYFMALGWPMQSLKNILLCRVCGATFTIIIIIKKRSAVKG